MSKILVRETDSKNKFERLTIVWSGILILLSLIVVTYGIFHTFDWSDEAWALSLIANNRETVGEPYAFQYLVHPIYVFLGENIIAVRFLRFTAFLALSVFSAFMLIKITETRGLSFSKNQKTIVYIVSQLGTILVWSWPPRYFSYNELSSILVQVIALLLAYSFFSAEKDTSSTLKNSSHWIIWISIGLATGLLFYAKVTPFLLVAPSVLISAIILAQPTKFVSLLASIIGAGFGVLLPYIAGLPLSQYFDSILLNLFDENVRTANAHSSSILQMYLIDLGSAALTLLPFAILLFSVLVILLPVYIEPARSRGALQWLALAILYTVGIFILLFVLNAGSGPGVTGRLATVVVTIAILVIVFLSVRPVRTTLQQNIAFATAKSWVGAFFIIISTVVVSLGTNNSLTFHFGYGSSTWAATFAVAMVLLHRAFTKLTPHLSWVPPVVIIYVLSLGLGSAFLDAKSPYRSASFMSNDTPSVIGGPFEGLNLTKPEVELQTWLAAQADQLDAVEAPTISLKSPGVLFAFNNSDFASPWLHFEWPASFWSIEKACAAGVPNRLFVLVPSAVPHDSADYEMLRDSLASGCGFKFPQDFKLVVTHKSTNSLLSTEIWQLKPKG